MSRLQEGFKDIEWKEHKCDDCGSITNHLVDDKSPEPTCAKCVLEHIGVVEGKGVLEEETIDVEKPVCIGCFTVVEELATDNLCNTCASKTGNDTINWPKHYNSGNIQPIDVIEDWGLDFRLANAVKYIARHKHKGSAKKDLEKAVWYLQRYIDKELDK